MLIRIFILLLFPLLFWSDGIVFNKQIRTTTPPQYKAAILPQTLSSDTLQTLRLMFGGDIMSQLLQIEAAKISENTYDYTPCFQYVKPIFETADLAIANLECTLPGKPPYTGYPDFKSPEQLAKALKINGLDILVTSNNHSLDSGLEGLNNTISTLRREGFMQTGTFTDMNHKKLLYPLIIYKKGFKIALLNYTLHTNGNKTPQPAMVNRLETEQMKHDIIEARKMKPDVIITFLHWGEEYHLDENANQRELARLLHVWGSDLVIGAHPHVVEPIKIESTLIGKQKFEYLTAYSLGNFISAQPYPNTEGGIIFEVILKKQRGQMSIDDYAFIPVVRYTPFENGRQKYYALPVSPFEGHENILNMSAAEKAKMTHFANRVRAQLTAYGAEEHVYSLKDLKLE